MSSNTEHRAPNTTRDESITIYRPHMRHELGLFETWSVMARNVWHARELVWQLFKRDFFAQYKKSFMGFVWIFVSPLMGIVAWVFLWKANLLNPGETDVPYPAYVLMGQSAWTLFMGFYSSGHATLSGGKELMLQVSFPHEAILFQQLASQLANYVMSFVASIAVLFAFGVVPSWAVLFYPLMCLPLFFLGAAVGLMISMLSVVAFDLDRIIGLVIGFLIWTTPIRYSDRIESELVHAIIAWNPLTYLVCSARDMVLFGRFYNHNAAAYFACAAASLILFLVSWRLFYVSEHKLVERMI